MNAEKIKTLEIERQRLISEERTQQERERFATIKDLYNTFMEDDTCSKSSVYLNEDLLFITVGSYFDDIYK
jgi:patatin-like phospholipase/acyl hydrolase